MRFKSIYKYDRSAIQNPEIPTVRAFPEKIQSDRATKTEDQAKKIKKVFLCMRDSISGHAW